MREIPFTVYLVVAFVTLVANPIFFQYRRARQAKAQLDVARALFGAVGVAVILMIPLFYMLYITLGSPLIAPVLAVLQLLLTYGWAHLAAYALGAGRHWSKKYLPGVTFLLTVPLLFVFVRATSGPFLYDLWAAGTWALFFCGVWPWLRSPGRINT